MYGQMTAGSWIYIGTQGILQGTYECFAEIARRRFGGSLAGTITLTAGLGGMGGAQPLAVTMNGGVALCIDVDPQPCPAAHRDPLPRRGGRPTSTTPSPAALAARDRRAGRCSVGLVGNAAEVLPRLLDLDFPADIVTDQTSAHDPLSYVPVDVTPEAAAEMARTDPDGYVRRARESMAMHCAAMVGFLDTRRRGLRLRQQPARRGRARRLRPGVRLPGLPARLHPAAVLRGQGTVPVGRPVRRPGRHRGHRPGRARGVPRRRGPGPLDRAWPASGSRSRACRRASAGSATASAHRLGLRFNEMVRRGELSAPIVIGRDHLDSGSVASPYRETEAMADGSDAIADWPLLNALVNTSSGATWVSIHHGGGVGIGRSIHAGMVAVADGTDLAAEKLERVLTTDPGTGVIRHADAGYDRAVEVAAERGVRLPMTE